MKKISKSVNPIHQFWTLEVVLLIQEVSLMSQEGNGLIILP